MKTRNNFNHILTLVLALLLCVSLVQAVDVITPGITKAGTPATAEIDSYQCDTPQKCREIDEAWQRFAEDAGSPNFNQVWDVRTGEWADFLTVYPEESEESESQLPRTATEFSIIFSPEIINGILSSGKWSETADDTIAGEKLPWELVVDMAQENPGLLSLFLAVGEWGIESPPSDLVDPDNRNWAGTSSPSDGKHLMSYKYGKLGIAHYVGSRVEDIYDIYGQPSDRSTASAVWQTWAKDLLRRRDVQQYLIERWFEKFWTRAIRNSNGDIEKALVNARIANTAPADALDWGTLSIEEQLNRYATKHDEQDRVGTMRRAVVVYNYLNENNLLEVKITAENFK